MVYYRRSLLSFFLTTCMMIQNVGAIEEKTTPPLSSTRAFEEAFTNVKHIKDAEDFVATVYGNVLGLLQHNPEFIVDFAKTYFNATLKKDFVELHQQDHKTPGELGCIDFNVFTNSQESFKGFFVKAIKTHDNAAVIGVHLALTNLTELSDPRLQLELVKTSQGWRVHNMHYPNSQPLSKLLKSCLKTIEKPEVKQDEIKS